LALRFDEQFFREKSSTFFHYRDPLASYATFFFARHSTFGEHLKCKFIKRLAHTPQNPLCRANDHYRCASPTFEAVVMDLEGGKAPNSS
jgi:hypothetical protein